MDFVTIKERLGKKGRIEIYPSFNVCNNQDFMVRGKAFYAIWDPDKGLWSENEQDVVRLVDRELQRAYDSKPKDDEEAYKVMWMRNYDTKSWTTYRSFVRESPDCSKQLNSKIIFSNTAVKKSDYASRKLDYAMEYGDISAYDEMMSTLYSDEERTKLEWAIGSIISGDSLDIQKFVVLYGAGGTGKSTVLNIIQKMFPGYYTSFDAKELASRSNNFATGAFKNNPLIAIQHDGDLSRIEDNSKINSIVAHEDIEVNEKFKTPYVIRSNCFLFMGTNKPVKITDGKSGIIRRLIDVRPTGNKINPKRYRELYNQIDFELGAIAKHCLDVYTELGKDYYDAYRPFEMMFKTDVFYNFVENYYDRFEEYDGVTLKSAWQMYKEYCNDALVDHPLPMYKFREELKNYFKKYTDDTNIEGKHIRKYYSGFITNRFKTEKQKKDYKYSLIFDSTKSIFDQLYAECPAQYATVKDGTPRYKWANVKTKLGDLDTSKLHYVKVPENHIVIDFDIKNPDGTKSLEKNIEAASKFPPTYAELSKSGAGVHLHYIYEGDVEKLSKIYGEDIEIKVFTGNSSLRRMLTRCNDIPIASIASGLPLREEKPVINVESVKSEKALRKLIERNLNKEIHSYTAPSVDFICKILQDAYDSGLHYDVSDMYNRILRFAQSSHNQAEHCVKKVGEMKFHSDEPSESGEYSDNSEMLFFDVEVFINLFVVVYKAKDKKAIKMINPTPTDISELIKFKLVGFNCRRYDNHILYARLLGYSNEQLYNISQRIIDKDSTAFFREAYNLSYTDVYDFCSKKMSLKKWEIKLGIHHQELGLKWNEPVPEKLWNKVADYCVNDVEATEAVFYANQGDWKARQILAELSGLTVNDTTNNHIIRILVGKEKHPKLIYTDLATGKQY